MALAFILAFFNGLLGYGEPWQDHRAPGLPVAAPNSTPILVTLGWPGKEAAQWARYS